MGRIPPHPGCLRKSGKRRIYRMRNLEECTENESWFVRAACNRAIEMGAGILKELEGPRGGRAWLTRAGKNNKTIIAYWYSLSMIILSSLFAAGRLPPRAGSAESTQESKGDAVEACHSPVVA